MGAAVRPNPVCSAHDDEVYGIRRHVRDRHVRGIADQRNEPVLAGRDVRERVSGISALACVKL
jgi:hypothetical protein